jgi:hypothetical protein
MIRNISANNISFLKKLASPSHKWIVVSKSEVFYELIEWLHNEPLITTDFLLLTCDQPKKGVRILLKSYESSWTASDYIRFTKGRTAKIPDNLPSLYEGDGPRQPSFYAASFCGRYGINLPSSLKNAIRSIKVCQWLVCFLVGRISMLRPKYICAEYSSRMTSRILVCSDSTIEKDHYGENPLFKFRLFVLKKIIYTAWSEGRTPVIFIDVGPRWLYLRFIERLLKEMRGKQKGVHVIVTGGYRKMDRDECERIGLQFKEGNNVNAYGEIVYSDHCLEIGAGSYEIAIGYLR